MVWAVRLMYVSAAFVVVFTVVSILLTPHAEVSGGVFGSPPVIEQRSTLIGQKVFGCVVDTAAWLWMAWKNGCGRPWARGASTIFFVLFTLGIGLDFVRNPEVLVRFAALGIYPSLAGWLIAFAALILIWRPESTRVYLPQATE